MKFIAVFRDAGNCEIGEPIEVEAKTVRTALFLLHLKARVPNDTDSVTVFRSRK